MPLGNIVTSETTGSGYSQLTLNQGTVIDEVDESVLVRTSEYAYLDENGNEKLDREEEIDSYPVVASEKLGEGQVILVSDPSVFITRCWNVRRIVRS